MPYKVSLQFECRNAMHSSSVVCRMPSILLAGSMGSRGCSEDGGTTRHSSHGTHFFQSLLPPGPEVHLECVDGHMAYEKVHAIVTALMKVPAIWVTGSIRHAENLWDRHASNVALGRNAKHASTQS
eukprot:1082527-Pleurochrysis_carterae.AAC.4